MKTPLLGVIAQELEEIFPGLVDTDQDGFKRVKQSVFIYMLVSAIQSLPNKILEMKNKKSS